MVLFIVESVYKSLEVFLDSAIYRGKCLQVFRSVSGWCYLSWKVFTSLQKCFWIVLFIVESVYKSLEVFLDGAIYRGKCLQVFRSVSGWRYLSWKVFTSL